MAKLNQFIILISFNFLFCGLLKPLNGDNSLNYIHIYFEWDQEPNASKYQLQVSNQIVFGNLILDVEENSTAYIDKEHFDWETDYYWRVRAIYENNSYGDWIGTSYFRTKEKILPDLEVSIYNDNLIEDGLIMYSQFSPYLAVGVIDKNGNEIWNTQSVYMNHINENGQLYGVNGQGVQFNYDEQIIWATPNGTEIDGHEVKQIPNGNYMAFVPSYQQGPIPIGDWTNLFQSFGYAADGISNEFPWMGFRIVEWDQNTNQEIWNWDPFEHFSMDDHDLYGGMWWDAAFNGRFDWMHTNAFHFDEHESVIYVSHRHLSRISKISYPSGEIIWNMGLPPGPYYNTGNDNICSDLLFSWQHHIQLLENGDLLFFDNGNLSQMLIGDSNPTTRIRRIKVIEDAYCETVWQYDLPQNLFAAGMGSVQLLDNGNYSIYTYGNGLDESECSIIEITSDQELIWKATSQDPNSAWYRSYKIPSIHPNAFSVTVENLEAADENNFIELGNNQIIFNLYNKSGYNHTYKYQFYALNDLFSDEEGFIELDAYSNQQIIFEIQDTSLTEDLIHLNIWPEKHKYSKKEIVLSVVYNEILGDLNNDGQVNILDVVIVVNNILNDIENSLGDLNADSIVDVLDIVILINVILS